MDFEKNGILHCGVCGQPKEKDIPVIEVLGVTYGGKRVHILCKCEQDEINKRKADEERKEMEARANELRAMSLMDERFRSAEFRKWKKTEDNEKLYGMCSRYAEDFARISKDGQGLLFWGGVGTGKTYAAACIANRLMEKGDYVVMTSFVKILEEMAKNKGSEERIMDKIANARLLIIDDLGAERGTDYAQEKVYNIIDSRYRSGKPMILTTNLTLKAMLDESDIRYKRTYDRIFEMCYPMEFKGTSWRKRKAGMRFREMEEIFK